MTGNTSRMTTYQLCTKNINNIFMYIYIYFLSSIPTKIYQRSSYWSIWGTRSPTCSWKRFKYPSAVNVKTQKREREEKNGKERHVNKFKKYNPTKVLCSSCVPFWNTAVWGGKPLQPASPVDESLFEDGPSFDHPTESSHSLFSFSTVRHPRAYWDSHTVRWQLM